MKFNKHLWEKTSSVPPISKEMIEIKIRDFFPSHKLQHFEIIPTGLGNVNIFFKVDDLNDSFLLRIYQRAEISLEIEYALQEKFGSLIPMPEFLYIGCNEASTQRNNPLHFVIQKWLNGTPFFKFLESSHVSDLSTCVKSIAEVLAEISSIPFSEPGFFKRDLSIVPFENEQPHPFISYIEDCLFKGNGYAKKHLGEEFSAKFWDFVMASADQLPPLKPSCLVHGDFNFDNILISPDTRKVLAILDWEFAFSCNSLFDVGTFLRFELPDFVKTQFMGTLEAARSEPLPDNFEKSIKIQDLSNLIGLINHPESHPKKISAVKELIEETLEFVSRKS